MQRAVSERGLVGEGKSADCGLKHGMGRPERFSLDRDVLRSRAKGLAGFGLVSV